MEGSTNRCTKVQWRKGSYKDHFWKRSKFFVKSRIMASSCHNLNIQIGLQRNRLGGVGRRWSARQISKSWIQTGKQSRLIWSIDICWLFACYSIPSSSTGLPPCFAKKCVCMFARWCPIVQLFNWHLAPINSRFSFTNWEETQTYLPEFTT